MLVLLTALRWQVSSWVIQLMDRRAMTGRTVGGEREFFVLLEALGEFKARSLSGDPSDRALARAAGVTATTIGDWLRGAQFPQDIGRVLTVVRAVAARAASCGIGDKDIDIQGLFDEHRWRKAYQDEARRRAQVTSESVEQAQATAALAGPPSGRLLDQVSDPFALEVHRPMQPDHLRQELPVLPEYVSREHDGELAQVVAAAVAGQSGVAVLVGGSSTGKTRASWEALNLLRGRTPPWRLWHPIDPSRPEAALRELPAIGPRTVVWLNEAQFYLDAGDGVGERVAAGLRELLRNPARGPVLVLATMWPSFWDGLTGRPQANEDLHTQARELLAGRDITVPDVFTPLQLAKLTESHDPRLAQAAAGAQEGQVIQYLAGAPELLARYRNAPAGATALIHAAMDARRMGMRPALPHSFLEAAASGYLTDDEWERLADDWLEQALAYTATPCKGVRGPVTRIRPRPGRTTDLVSGRASEPAYRLADYLDQYGRRARRASIPPEAFWDAAVSHANPADLRPLGNAAERSSLPRVAARLYKRATAHGDPVAAATLVSLLHRLYPTDRRPADWVTAHAASDDPGGVARLLDALREAGAADQVIMLAGRAAAHTRLDDPGGVARLLDALREAGAAEQVTVLLARHPAAHTTLDNANSVARLLDALREADATDQIAVLLARRPAAHVVVTHTMGVAALLNAMRRVAATDQVAILANRSAARAPLDHPGGTAALLHALRMAEAADQVAVLLSRRPADHAELDSLGGVTTLLHELREAGAADQVAILADRTATHAALADPGGTAALLYELRMAEVADQIAMLLSRRPADHAQLDHPDRVTALLHELHEVGATSQVTTLANRSAAQAPLDHPGSTAALLHALRMVKAADQVAVLLNRRPADHAQLDHLDGITALLHELHEAGATSQVTTLANRSAAQAPLDDPRRTVALLRALRMAEAADQVAVLLSRRPADHAQLDYPDGIAALLHELREAGAIDQVAILANRAATHAALMHPGGAAALLRALRMAEAADQVAVLLSDAPPITPSWTTPMGSQRCCTSCARRARPTRSPYWPIAQPRTPS